MTPSPRPVTRRCRCRRPPWWQNPSSSAAAAGAADESCGNPGVTSGDEGMQRARSGSIAFGACRGPVLQPVSGPATLQWKPAWLWRCWIGLATLDGAQMQVVDLTRVIQTNAAVPVKDHHARRAAHPMALHRHQHRTSWIGLVDTDRERNPVPVQENAQGLGPHHIVVLEDGVQADHRDLFLREQPVDAQSLRQAVRHATRAQHLEGVQHHCASAQALQGHQLRRVEPQAGLQGLGCAVGGGHDSAARPAEPGAMPCRAAGAIPTMRLQAARRSLTAGKSTGTAKATLT